VDFSEPLIAGTLVRRYKRFLADVVLEDGTALTAHCPNTGSMLGCQTPGSRVWLSLSDNPKRKYAHTWELVELDGGALVGINTGRSNALVREAIESGLMGELGGYDEIRPEVRYGDENSRVDFLLTGTNGACYVEVKNVTAAVREGIALFPDAVSTRAARHLRELLRRSRSAPGRRNRPGLRAHPARGSGRRRRGNRLPGKVRPADGCPGRAYSGGLSVTVESGVANYSSSRRQ
jgi:sugar fermentation stimulation protein A